jgi:hypothetical protein
VVVPVSAEPEATSPPAPPPPAPAPEPVPSFLDLEQPLERFTLRAKIFRKGVVLEEDSEPPPAQPTSKVLQEVVALEETKHNVRVLCEATARVAVYVPRYDLAVVALAGALLVPAPPLPAAIDERTPGVHFLPGTILDEVAPDSQDEALVRVRFRGFLLEAQGVALASRTGHVFHETAQPEHSRDVEFRGGARFLGAPQGGRVVAELGAYANPGQKHFGRKIEQKGGSILVRYLGSEAHVVGWVPAAEVRAIPARASSLGYGTGSGRFSPRDKTVALERGTLLRGRASNKPIGVVVRDAPFKCLERCEAGAPVVQVGACTGSLALVAEVRR